MSRGRTMYVPCSIEFVIWATRVLSMEEGAEVSPLESLNPFNLLGTPALLSSFHPCSGRVGRNFSVHLAQDAEATSANEPTRVAEQPHPAAVRAGVFRTPGILHVTHRTLRMRHRDCHAPVGVAQGGNCVRRPVGVERVGLRHRPVMMDVPVSDQAAFRTGSRRRRRSKFGMAL